MSEAVMKRAPRPLWSRFRLRLSALCLPRIVPRSLAGWFLLIIMVVMILSVAVELVTIFVVGSQIGLFIQRDRLGERVESAERLFQITPKAVWPEAAKLLSTDRFVVSIVDPDPKLMAERAAEAPLLEAAGEIDRAQRAAFEAKLGCPGQAPGACGAQFQDALAKARALAGPIAMSNDTLRHAAAETLMHTADLVESGKAPERDNIDIAIDISTDPEERHQAPLSPDHTATEIVLLQLGGDRLATDLDNTEPHEDDLNLNFRVERGSPFFRPWLDGRPDQRPFIDRPVGQRDHLIITLPLSTDHWARFVVDEGKIARLDYNLLLQRAMEAGGILILISGFAIIRMTAPLRRFADATRRLGRDLDAPPLPETGPGEVKQAARAFNEMQANIRSFVRDRTAMLAAISHDLRTPLTRLRLRADFMAEDQQARYLNDLDEMEAMITAVMAFGRDDAAAEPREMVALDDLLKEIAGNYVETGAPVRLGKMQAVRAPIRIMAVKRALANLIDNAIAYGGAAELSLRRDKEGIHFIVDDRGPGIPPDKLEQVFAPFFRLEGSRNRATGGVGLGLSIVRSVARAHGGDVTLTNRTEGGLRAVFSLRV